MAQPVKLSDQLVLDARVVGGAVERSISGQIEYWARIGRAIEPLLQGNQAQALSEAGAAMALSDCFESAGSDEGKRRLQRFLSSRPFPHFEAAQDSPGLLIRIDQNGKRTIGRFVNRKFLPLHKPAK
jgi:hypothetical protein